MRNLSMGLFSLLGVFLFTSVGQAEKPRKPFRWTLECTKGYDRIGDIDAVICLKTVKGKDRGMALCKPNYKRSGERKNGHDRCDRILGKSKPYNIKCPAGHVVKRLKRKSDRCYTKVTHDVKKPYFCVARDVAVLGPAKRCRRK
jgi:hypothetical protein